VLLPHLRLLKKFAGSRTTFLNSLKFSCSVCVVYVIPI